jgi:hypothetical protein
MSQQCFAFDTPAPISRKSDPITSQKSAAETEPKLGRYQELFVRCLRFLKEATANEVAIDAVLLGSGGANESYRKRALELVRAGRIVECGERKCQVTGKTATVYKLKEQP